MNSQKFLVTGALGCIGAWVTRHLVSEGTEIIATDVSDDFSRLRLLMTDAELTGLDFRKVDVTDSEALQGLIESNSVSHVIHLAGLQVPFCKADPVLGSALLAPYSALLTLTSSKIETALPSPWKEGP